MHRKHIMAAALTAALALTGFGSAVVGQDGESESLTGTVVAVPNADGGTDYYLQLEDGTQVLLELGPSWYWSDSNPLAALVGQEVTLDGHMSDGIPDENAADIAKENAVEETAFEVRVIDGEPLWATSIPPWAGGPKVVGEAHPGFAGWSHGQAMSAGDEAAEEEAVEEEADGLTGKAMAESRKGGPKVAGETHPGYKGWSRGQGNRAANPEAAKAKVKAKGGGAPEGRGRS